MKKSFLFRIVLTIVPSVCLFFTASQLIFGEQGLFHRRTAELQLEFIQSQQKDVEQKNDKLRLKIEQLSSSPHQKRLIAAERLQRSTENSTIFIFRQMDLQ